MTKFTISDLLFKIEYNCPRRENNCQKAKKQFSKIFNLIRYSEPFTEIGNVGISQGRGMDMSPGWDMSESWLDAQEAVGYGSV